MSKEKRQISVYKINTTNEIFNDSTDYLLTLFSTIKQTINILVQILVLMKLISSTIQPELF